MPLPLPFDPGTWLCHAYLGEVEWQDKHVRGHGGRSLSLGGFSLTKKCGCNERGSLQETQMAFFSVQMLLSFFKSFVTHQGRSIFNDENAD